MSHISHPSTLLDPNVAARLTDAMLAAMALPEDAEPEQQIGHDTALIEQVDALRARDFAEHIAAVQVTLHLHHTMQCFGVLGRLDPASKEASQMRRETLAMSRGLMACERLLQKAQSRRLDAEGHQDTSRPGKPPPVRTPQPEDGWLRELPDDPPPEPEQDAAPIPAPPVDRSQYRSMPFEKLPRKLQALYNANPDLKRLREHWDDMPRWEDMTMEERREMFGYKYNPPPPASATPEQAPETPEQPSGTPPEAGG